MPAYSPGPGVNLKAFDRQDGTHCANAAAIWSAACGPDLAIPQSFVEFNTRPTTGGAQSGRLAIDGDQVVGFVLASILRGDPETSPPDLGYIDAIAVLPRCQRTGIGTTLLAWAEAWLIEQGCTHTQLGASMRTFVPGLPVGLGAEPFFRHRGYADHPEESQTWDVARDLADYISPPTVHEIDGVVCPARPGEEEAVLAFLQREFPGRWRFEFQECLREGGRLSDFVLLRTNRGIDGCCHLTFADSLQPLARYYPYRLPQPWGQLGSIGVSADRRGQGYGSALLDGALRRLRDQHVRGCVIDWTNLLDFYGRFGFKPYRRYSRLLKEFQAHG